MVLTLKTHNQLSRRAATPLYSLPADWLQPAEEEHHWCTQQLLMTCDIDLEKSLFTSGPSGESLISVHNSVPNWNSTFINAINNNCCEKKVEFGIWWKKRWQFDGKIKIWNKELSKTHKKKTHREEHVFLVLVDGSGVWDGISVLDHTDRLTFKRDKFWCGVGQGGKQTSKIYMIFCMSVFLSCNTYQWEWTGPHAGLWIWWRWSWCQRALCHQLGSTQRRDTKKLKRLLD